MRLTINGIRSAHSDKELLDKLCAELERRLPDEVWEDRDTLVAHLRMLPPGLRAMAATHSLDVSMALDDLGWHFANWHHHEFCEETSRGLLELGLNEIADWFNQAYQLVLPHWDAISDMLAVDFKVFLEWYNDSPLEKALSPLNQRLWVICDDTLPDPGLMKFWVDYARKHPARVVSEMG